MIILTTNDFPGKKITEVKGLVKAGTVETKNAFKDIGAGFKSLIGGKLNSYTKMMHVALQVAEQEIIAQAEELGANAIIAYRLGTTNTTGAGSAEVFAYGTAVIVK